MHRSGRKGEPGQPRVSIPVLFVAIALLGLALGAAFGTYIIRSLIDATTPSPGSASGGSIPGGTTPGGSTPSGTAPGGNTPGGTTPGTSLASIRVQVQARTLYAVQIGAFSERAQAQNVAAQAEDKGLPSDVWDPVSGQDKLFRVRTGVGASRPAADAFASAAKAAGYGEAFVASVEAPTLDLTVEALSATYLDSFRDAVDSLDGLLEAELAAWDAFARGGFSSSALKAHTGAVNAAAAKARQALAGVTPPADLKTRHEVLQGLINMADASVLEMAEAAAGVTGKYQRSMSEFMGFVEAFIRTLYSWR